MADDPTQGSPAIPPGGVIPYLTIVGGAGKDAVDFYIRAFAGVEEYRALGQDSGKIMHSRLRINDAYLMLSDDFPEMRGGQAAPPPASVMLHLSVDDADLWWDRAVREGATIAMPIADMFWGDRYGQLKDPFGHTWSVSSPAKKG
jgi:PhnB protein